MLLNIQENRDMIASSLIFIMLQRGIIYPFAIYLCISVYWEYDALVQSKQPTDQLNINNLRAIFVDNLIVCLLGCTEVIGTAMAFTINTICFNMEDLDPPVLQLTNEDLMLKIQKQKQFQAQRLSLLHN